MLSSLILCNNNEPFLERIVTCDKWILYDNQQWPAQWLDWEEAPKHFPKPNLHQEKVIVTGGLLPIWSTTAFWILVKPLHLRTMLSKLMWCLQKGAVSRKGTILLHNRPDYPSHNQRFKSWTDWSSKVCLICHIPANSCQQAFCRENASTTSRRQKMLSKN